MSDIVQEARAMMDEEAGYVPERYEESIEALCAEVERLRAGLVAPEGWTGAADLVSDEDMDAPIDTLAEIAARHSLRGPAAVWRDADMLKRALRRAAPAVGETQK